jgi:hypothetical protein
MFLTPPVHRTRTVDSMHYPTVPHRTNALVDFPDAFKHRWRPQGMSDGQRRDGRYAGDRIEIQIA